MSVRVSDSAGYSKGVSEATEKRVVMAKGREKLKVRETVRVAVRETVVW